MNLEKLSAIAANLPDAYKANANDLITRMGEVIEGIGDRDVTWRPQTLKLVQAMSDRSKLPKGANIGDFLLGEDVVTQPKAVIVLRSWDARQYWSPDQNETKMLCSSPDAVVGYIGKNCKDCEFSKFDEETKKTQCNKIKVFMVAAADLSDVFLIQFAKTGFKTGGDWNNLMKKAGVATYRRVYGVKSVDSKEYKNVVNFGVETFEGDKRDTPKEILEFVAELFTQVSTDRKESVDEFHKIILTRKQDPALLANSAADSEMVLIPDTTEAVPAAAAAPAGKSSLAKKYNV